MSGIKGFRGWLVLGLASAGVAAAVPSGAGATTGIEETKAMQVTLTKDGVVFNPRVRAHTDLTLEMRITNQAGPGRWFRFGTRQSRPLRKGESTMLYYAFFRAGKVGWQSFAPGGKRY